MSPARKKNNVDSLVRLGQTRAAKAEILSNNSCPKQAKEELMKSLRILTRAINIIQREDKMKADDYNAFHQRGLIHRKLEDHKNAIIDFREAIKRNPKHFTSCNYLGHSLASLGLFKDSMEVYQKCYVRNPNNIEICKNLAQCKQNWGDYKGAEKYFSRAIAIGGTADTSPHALRGLCRYASGHIQKAVEDFTIRHEDQGSKEHISLHMRSTAYWSLGQFSLAWKDFTQLMKQNPPYPALVCWFRKEIIPAICRLLDTPFSNYHFDNELHPSLKDVYLKLGSPNEVARSYTRFKGGLKSNIKDVNLCYKDLSSQQKKIRTGTSRLGKLLLSQSSKFLANVRQVRMFGMVVIEIAQAIKSHWKKTIRISGKGSSKDRTPHDFTWRDMMDIAVRWKQHSEPNDHVFWIDMIESSSFRAGFGLHTPLINGHMKVPKYSSYFPHCFKLLLKLVPEQEKCLTNEKKKSDQTVKNDR